MNPIYHLLTFIRDRIPFVGALGVDWLRYELFYPYNIKLSMDDIVFRTQPKKVVMVSGGFDPVHVGHLKMFEEAKSLGDWLVVVLNCDDWLVRKKGRAFMNQADRARLILALKPVDEVYVLQSDRADVCEALELFKPSIFANGGDRKADNIPEYETCEKLGIKMVFDVGGGKYDSSSALLKKYSEWEDCSADATIS